MSTRAIRGPFRFNTVKTVLSGDYTVVNESLVFVNKTNGAATAITLPASGTTGGGYRCVIVIDAKGDANVNNITITAAGTDTINGGATLVINAAYGAKEVFDAGGGVWVAK